MTSKFDALISLIEDPDSNIRTEIAEKILELGDSILPTLKDSLENKSFDSPEGYQALQQLIEEIEFKSICRKIKTWFDEGASSLLEGLWLISHLSGSEVSLEEINKEIERIKLEVWLELRPELTALEKINILNHVFFKRFNFAADIHSYHSPDNSFIHKVIKRRKGNPISIACLYALVAQRLFIPVYGVNLPQHFILAYVDLEDLPEPGADSKGLTGNPPLDAPILFYINPFNEGTVFGKKHIEKFLHNLQIDDLDTDFFTPCTNQTILLRVCRNLINAYGMKNKTVKVSQYSFLLQLLSHEQEK
jgi:regulator of sirC expression with transglutaminase-like and TPR domain